MPAFDVRRQRSIAVINASGVCSWNGPYTFNDFSGRATARKPIEQLLLDNTWLDCIGVTNMVEYGATFLTLGNVFFSVVRINELGCGPRVTKGGVDEVSPVCPANLQSQIDTLGQSHQFSLGLFLLHSHSLGRAERLTLHRQMKEQLNPT